MTNLVRSWPDDVHDMHTKFRFHEAISNLSSLQLALLLSFRLNFLQEELNEAQKANRADDIVDAMIDLCVVAIGTLDLFQIDIPKAWDRVQTANLAKEVGVKLTRPNPYGFPDLIKPEGWTAPTHIDNVGLLAKIYE